MEKIVCKECGKVFEYPKLSSCKAQLKRHIREEHKMSILDYVVKHEYGGKRPICPCGCGHPLNLSQSRDRWKFTKYYADTCYGRLVRQCNDEVLKQYKETHKRDFDLTKYYEANYDRETYQEAFDMLKTKQFSLSDVSKSFQIDKRTLKKVWLALKITDVSELNEILDYTKYHLSTLNRPSNTVNDDNVLSWTYNLIKKFPGKYTPHSLKNAYNECHKESPTNKSSETITKALYKTYGDEIELYLSNGFHSSEEYKFYEILSFYLPDYRIKLGKKFVLEDNYVFYDIMVGSKLLIEYDSDGFFHTSEESANKDINKEKFAKENGYKFLRLTKTDILDINTIIKIKNLLSDEIS